jgi:hypothetical protein
MGNYIAYVIQMLVLGMQVTELYTLLNFTNRRAQAPCQHVTRYRQMCQNALPDTRDVFFNQGHVRDARELRNQVVRL